MKLFATEIRAIDPVDGNMKTFAGPNVPAISWSFAERYCQDNGLGYCRVIGQLVAEIPFDFNDKRSNPNQRIDYDVSDN